MMRWRVDPTCYKVFPFSSRVSTPRFVLGLRAALALLMAVGAGDTVQKLDLVVKRLHALGAPKANRFQPRFEKALIGTICHHHLPSPQLQHHYLC